MGMTPPTLRLVPALPPVDCWAQEVTRWLARYRTVTRTTYQRQIMGYTFWCAENNIDPWEARKGDIEAYLVFQAERLAESSVALSYDAVGSFYSYLFDDDLIAKNPCHKISRPTIHKEGQRRTWLTPLQYAAFLNAAMHLGPDEHAVAALGGMMGLRSAEMCQLDVTSVMTEGAYTVIKFIGKGNKPATAPLPIPVLRPVMRLMDMRPEGALLRNKAGNRFDTRSMVRVVARIATQAKLPVPITPHGLRRTFATTGLSTGISDRDMMAATRHAQSSTLHLCDMGGGNLDRHASHRIAGFLFSYTD